MLERPPLPIHKFTPIVRTLKNMQQLRDTRTM